MALEHSKQKSVDKKKKKKKKCAHLGLKKNRTKRDVQKLCGEKHTNTSNKNVKQSPHYF